MAKYLDPKADLTFINDIFEPDMPEFYHYYRMVHEEHTDKVIDGLNLVFVELPKFLPQTVAEKKMQVLWLRFLTEIGEKTRQIPEEFLENPEIKRAVEIVEESAYSEAELYAYDKFWDTIRVEQAFVDEAEIRYGMGFEKGIKETKRENARRMKAKGFAISDIAEITGLSRDEIEGM